MGALGAFISGAGPSIIAVADAQDKTFLSRAQMYCADHFPDWTPIRLDCDEMGAVVREI
jgi:homoserine kinase